MCVWKSEAAKEGAYTLHSETETERIWVREEVVIYIYTNAISDNLYSQFSANCSLTLTV